MKKYYVVGIVLASLALYGNLNAAARPTSGSSTNTYSLDENEARAQQTKEVKSTSAQAYADLVAALKPQLSPTSEETKEVAAAGASSFLPGITPDNAKKVLIRLGSYIGYGMNGDFEDEYFYTDEDSAIRHLIVQALKSTGATDQDIKNVWQAGYAYSTIHNRIFDHMYSLSGEIMKDPPSSKKYELFEAYQKEEALAKKELQQPHEEWLAQAGSLLALYYSIFYNTALIPVDQRFAISNPEKLREIDKDNLLKVHRDTVARYMPD